MGRKIQMYISSLILIIVDCRYHDMHGATRPAFPFISRLKPNSFEHQRLNRYSRGYSVGSEYMLPTNYNDSDLNSPPSINMQSANNSDQNQIFIFDNPVTKKNNTQNYNQDSHKDLTHKKYLINETADQRIIEKKNDKVPEIKNGADTKNNSTIKSDMKSTERYVFTNDAQKTMSMTDIPKVIYIPTNGLQDNHLYKMIESQTQGNPIIVSRAHTNKGPLYYVVKPNTVTTDSNSEHLKIQTQDNEVLNIINKKLVDRTPELLRNTGHSKMDSDLYNNKNENAHFTLLPQYPKFDKLFTNVDKKHSVPETDTSFKSYKTFDNENIPPIIVILSNQYTRGGDGLIKSGQNLTRSDRIPEINLISSVIKALTMLPAFANQEFKLIQMLPSIENTNSRSSSDKEQEGDSRRSLIESSEEQVSLLNHEISQSNISPATATTFQLDSGDLIDTSLNPTNFQLSNVESSLMQVTSNSIAVQNKSLPINKTATQVPLNMTSNLSQPSGSTNQKGVITNDSLDDDIQIKQDKEIKGIIPKSVFTDASILPREQRNKNIKDGNLDTTLKLSETTTDRARQK